MYSLQKKLQRRPMLRGDVFKLRYAARTKLQPGRADESLVLSHGRNSRLYPSKVTAASGIPFAPGVGTLLPLAPAKSGTRVSEDSKYTSSCL